MMKISIIGANSFIARNLIFDLKRKRPADKLFLYDYAERQIDDQKDYQKISILEKESLANVELDVDLIYVFVGKTGSGNGFDEYTSFLDINEIALLNILDECRKRGCKAKIVFPSTRLVYKGATGKLKEDAAKEFKTIYSINKFSCEQYLKQYHNVFGLRYVIFRICVPYGSFIPNANSYGTTDFMIQKARNGENIILYGDGSSRRTLTHMEDLCDALIMGACCTECENDVYNIGGEDYSLKEMAELIAVGFGVNIDYVSWPELALKIESGDTVFDDSKLGALCNIKYKHRFIDWCRENIQMKRK